MYMYVYVYVYIYMVWRRGGLEVTKFAGGYDHYDTQIANANPQCVCVQGVVLLGYLVLRWCHNVPEWGHSVESAGTSCKVC